MENCDQVSYTTSPVTQVALVDVNSAFKNGVPFPSLLAKGSVRSRAPKRMIRANPDARLLAVPVFQ